MCLARYNMCFVFIADNKRALEERKQQSLILYAGQAFLRSKVWSIHTLRAGSTWGGVGGYAALDTAFTHILRRWTKDLSGKHCWLITCTHMQNRRKIPPLRKHRPTWKQNEQLNSIRLILDCEHGRRGWGACFSIKSFIK